MSGKLYNRLLLFSLLGTAMWFFGNLYEAIVIAPNILQNTTLKIQYWQNFFTNTNPALYYTPLTTIASLALLLVYFKTPRQNAELKSCLKTAGIFQLVAYALSVYIITQINFKLFFADLTQYDQNQIYTKAILWNVLNLVRLILVGVSMIFIFKACLKNQKT